MRFLTAILTPCFVAKPRDTTGISAFCALQIAKLSHQKTHSLAGRAIIAVPVWPAVPCRSAVSSRQFERPEKFAFIIIDTLFVINLFMNIIFFLISYPALFARSCP
jgi:hypothetical protein